ncbi:MAG: D-2-hydroxyacid dehydrogenase family protein [Comamonadaceae bacterium]|nr:MAG: D-2-hydroxyacid dehydrogenase family protein [Comamonadaceae bacterium]
MKITILDDYQGVALTSADWTVLQADVVSLRDHIEGDALIKALAESEVVVAMRERTRFPAEVLAQLPRLKLLVTTGARNAAIDLQACQRQGITVCGTGSQPYAAAELTWALILAAVKQVPVSQEDLRAGRWQTVVPGDLAGKTLGVLGLGKLGARVARVAQAFDMKVLAWSQNLTPEKAAEHGVTWVDKQALFEQSDIVSVHLVLSDRSRGIVGAQEIDAMRRDAIFVNTSRAGLVDEAALIEALHAGRIAAAALDVFAQEPLPADAPILSAPRTVLTPHLGYVTTGTYAIYFRDAIDNILAWRAGTPKRLLTT